MAQKISGFDIHIYNGYSLADVSLIESFTDPDASAEWGYIVEFTGARTRMAALWNEAKNFHGSVLGLPVPCDFRAETAEWAGVLKSVDSARNKFVAMELGAGHGTWSVGSGVAARLRGIKDIKLYAVEGDAHHFDQMRQHFEDNGFDPTDHTLLNMAVGTHSSTAYWPKVDNSNSDEWGLRPSSSNEKDYAGRDFEHLVEIEVISFAELIRRETRWDLVHMDIQGFEVDICRSCIADLSERVAWIVVGTHSRKIDGDLIELFSSAGWSLENEKPTIFAFTVNPPSLEGMTALDGIQVWKNPRLGAKNDALPKSTKAVAEIKKEDTGYRKYSKLNFGCGYDKREGYLNIDMDENCCPDLLIRDMNFAVVPKTHFEEVCALDVLEHIPRSNTLSIMLDWAEFLKMDGRLILQTSSILGISKLISESNSYADHHNYTIYMYGNQAHDGDFHHTGFTETTLKTHLVAAGFEASAIETQDRWLFFVDSKKIYDWAELAQQPYLNLQEFITAAYRDALGREADQDGRTFLTEKLMTGSWSRRDALKHLFQSPERLYRAAALIGL